MVNCKSDRFYLNDRSAAFHGSISWRLAATLRISYKQDSFGHRHIGSARVARILRELVRILKCEAVMLAHTPLSLPASDYRTSTGKAGGL